MSNMLFSLRFLAPYAAIFLIIQLGIRIILLGYASANLDFSLFEILGAFFIGTYFDVMTTAFVLLPAALFITLTPARFRARMDILLRSLCSYVWLFTAVAEFLFWQEFNTRFNFIAVDYLVYTQEVIGNIVESYPIGWLLAAIGICAIGVAYLSLKFFPANTHKSSIRWKAPFVLAAIACAFYGISATTQSNFSKNTEANELAANGIYNLFYAYGNNEINFEQFYKTNNHESVATNTRSLLEEDEMGVSFVSSTTDDFTRLIRNPKPELHKNVIIVVMESMSAMYMGRFGNDAGLTPNLDQLANESLFFSNLYATGTRTVRGLEAVTLSIPPTPGQSIIRRTDNGELFSLGYIFKDRGYDTKFIYGGYGYFDNMNAFFAGNGFEVVDRANFPKDQIEFANIWGVSDEDLFKQVIQQADTSYADKKPFMHVVMTTSNHRPYTYPEGRIDIPSKKGGRFGGVKYADFSVGQLLKWSETKPWYKDTMFVFVADHTAGSSGKIELDPVKYHIPMIVYAPNFIKPKVYDKIASQIDLAPVLLGQLNFSYYSKFYGEDVIHDTDEKPHAFISSYQKVGLLNDDGLTLLEPQKYVEHFNLNTPIKTLAEQSKDENDTIAYYQSASWWRENFKRIPTVVK